MKHPTPIDSAQELPTVSVVILTSGDRAVFDLSLESALADPAATEVIVVIDDSQQADRMARDRATEIARRASAESRLRVATLSEAARDKALWRVQRGRDFGARLANCELVLALDDDVVLDPGVVTAHARAHAADAELVMVGYMPVVTHQRWPRGNATIRYYAASYEAHCRSYEEDPDSILTNVWGGNLSLSRENWLRAMRRPRTAAWGHDDQELGLLLLRDGMHAAFDRRLRGAHHYRRSLSGFVERAELSPAAQAALRAANPDLLPAPPPPYGRRERLSAPLLAAARSRLFWALLRTGLQGLLVAAGVLRIDRLGDRAAGYLWFLARERSARAIAQT